VDFKQLIIRQEKAVIVIYVDVLCLTCDGNLLDAAILACMAALKTTRLPMLSYDDETGIVQQVHHEESEKELTLRTMLLPATFGFFEDWILADPTLNEESVLEGTMTVVYNDQGGISGLFKQGGRPLKQEQIDHILNEAYQRSRTLRELLI
jgi:exosome complex component RRP43